MLHPFAHGKFNLVSHNFGKSITGPSPPKRHALFLSELNTNCNIKIAKRPRLYPTPSDVRQQSIISVAQRIGASTNSSCAVI